MMNKWCASTKTSANWKESEDCPAMKPF